MLIPYFLRTWEQRWYLVVEDYFDGSFGANHSDDQKPEKLRIKVFDTQADYIRALPIHESQVEVETTDEWCVFEYRVVPCTK